MSVKPWFIYSMLSLFFWGLWGFFAKLSTNYVNPRSAFIFTGTGVILVGIFIVFFLGARPEIHTKGAIFGLLAGIAGTLGTVMFFFSMSKGKASVVVTLTALYPLLTVLLSMIILKEHVSIKQAVGMFFAVLAMALFAS